eukprot:3368292-Pyramimonas_sp.AAC.1
MVGAGETVRRVRIGQVWGDLKKAAPCSVEVRVRQPGARRGWSRNPKKMCSVVEQLVQRCARRR